MRIGIDLDGVVFNTEMLWATYAELYDFIDLGRNSVVKMEEPRVQEKYNWTKEELDTYIEKYIYIKDFDIMPGAKEVLDLLEREGHELMVITARGSLTDSHDGCDIAKEKLEKAGIKFSKYFWKQKEKVDICKKENIDIMIDDNYRICEAISNENICAIYFQSLNRKHVIENVNLKEVSNWGEIYRIINNLSNK